MMDFYQRVAIVCKAIPAGKVATYGQIALLCGCPRNSRQVGYGLNKKMTEDVPAHRVVNHQGYLSGAQSFETYDLQRRLLAAEGVEVSSEQRVNLQKFGWSNTMEEAYAFRTLFGKDGFPET